MYISGYKTNESSMFVTVRRLGSAGVAVDHGKKIMLSLPLWLGGIIIH